MATQAIETKYNGYRFRSRLEARWAVFFDEAGIEYQYESQGYILPKKQYLPDFFLPQQDCFIEIKGAVPTDKEDDTCKHLATMTGKDVFIFYGDMPCADLFERDRHQDKNRGTHAWFPAYLDCRRPGLSFLDQRGKREKRALALTGISPEGLAEIESSIDIFNRCDQSLSDLGLNSRSTLKHLHKQVSKDTWDFLRGQWATIDDFFNWDIDFFGFWPGDCGYTWGQCEHCRKFSVVFDGWDERLSCKGEGVGQCSSYGKRRTYATADLRRAYDAARSARFEHGETPKVLRGKPR